MENDPKDQGGFFLNTEQQSLLNQLLTSTNEQQKIWISGYLAGVTRKNTEINQLEPISTKQSTDAPSITILYGTRSGNSQAVAEQAAELYSENGFKTHCFDMSDYKPNNLKNEKNLLVVVSTHGEGVPPIAAEEFYEFLHSKRAPKLNGLNFSVCALGDSSYLHFCKTGIDFETRLLELGATKIHERVDCDVDFEDLAESWVESSLKSFQEKVAAQLGSSSQISSPKPARKDKSQYSKKNPYQALVLNKVKLSGRGSQKENYHIELSIEDSGLDYKPGDAIGVLPKNSGALVDSIIKKQAYNPDEVIQNGVGNKTLRELLMNHYELTVLTKDVLSKYADLSGNEEVAQILQDSEKLKNYIYGRDLFDLLNDYPMDKSPQELVSILRKLQPRLYSISSSLEANPDEVHITVGAVRYEKEGREKEGVCSTFLADRIEEDETIPVFIDRNTNFSLPDQGHVPIIMVGPGTGIAPFRGFVQEREASGATGKNWLIFGDQHFTTDFLYQTEWQKYLKKGVLTKLDVAFSRDQEKKVYVQHRMLENAEEIYAWLEEGAHFYVCGDMKSMAPDVHHALIEIVEKEGNMSHDAAHNYVRQMQKEKRYQEDVY